MTSDERRASFGPSAAFAHPLFAIALFALVLNDHVLKGAGVAPAWITGKLSDVAGLIVAPAVLAWIARAKTPQGWTIAHACVAIGFSVLQLWPPLARAIEAGTAAIGVPAYVWPDPTDLIALPALALSWIALGPRARSRMRAPLIGVFALIACTATSQSPPPRYPYRPGGVMRADVFVRNARARDLTLKVQRVRDSVVLDCDHLADPPEEALHGGDFGEEQTWTLAQGDAVPLWDRLHHAPDRPCYAVRLETSGRAWILTWRDGEPPVHDVTIGLPPSAPAEPDAVVIPETLDTPDASPRVPPGVNVLPPR